MLGKRRGKLGVPISLCAAWGIRMTFRRHFPLGERVGIVGERAGITGGRAGIEHTYSGIVGGGVGMRGARRSRYGARDRNLFLMLARRGLCGRTCIELWRRCSVDIAAELMPVPEAEPGPTSALPWRRLPGRELSVTKRHGRPPQWRPFAFLGRSFRRGDLHCSCGRDARASEIAPRRVGAASSVAGQSSSNSERFCSLSKVTFRSQSPQILKTMRDAP
jgi:hypothetical protein